jgi:arylsulfatase A-like enzyme
MLGLVLAIGCGAPPRDVIVLTLDTTRNDHLGVYGYPFPISPRLDGLARDAVVFDHAWSTAPWTLPAHASMLTGKHPTSHGAHFAAERGDSNLGEAVNDPELRGVKANRLPDSQVTLAELLRARGYATAVFAGGPWLSPPFGLLQGYERRDADVREIGGRSASELTDAALAWLAGVPEGRPLHMLVNYYDPHMPYEPDDADLVPTSAYADAASLENEPPGPRRRLEHLNIRLRRRYDGEIRGMDRHLGRLLDGLKAAGRYDEAMIVVVGDHGELLGEHGLYAHPVWHYEELLRVPLLVKFPFGRGAGTRVEGPISVVDLLPMIAAELDLDLPDDVEGLPVGERALVVAESFQDPHAIAMLGPEYDRALATGIRWPWKLVTSSAGPPQLFQLVEDPGEQRDRAAEEPDVVASIQAALDAARSAMAAPQPAAPSDLDATTVDRLRELGYVE